MPVAVTRCISAWRSLGSDYEVLGTGCVTLMQFCPTDDCFAFVVAACLNFPQEIERRQYV